jgi:hypothetical protein
LCEPERSEPAITRIFGVNMIGERQVFR